MRVIMPAKLIQSARLNSFFRKAGPAPSPSDTEPLKLPTHEQSWFATPRLRWITA
jgi:hypothetical protein